jgi:hypothetical protein
MEEAQGLRDETNGLNLLVASKNQLPEARMLNGDKNLKLDSGLPQLEEWADNARQAQKNQVYKALFAVTDGSVGHHYGVLADKEDPNAHFVLVREDLVLKVTYTDSASFGISYIGPLAGAPGISLALQAF